MSKLQFKRLNLNPYMPCNVSKIVQWNYWVSCVVAFVLLIKKFDYLMRTSIKQLRQAMNYLFLFILDINQNKKYVI